MAKGLLSQPLVAYSFCVSSMRKCWREKTVEREMLTENNFFFFLSLSYVVLITKVYLL